MDIKTGNISQDFSSGGRLYSLPNGEQCDWHRRQSRPDVGGGGGGEGPPYSGGPSRGPPGSGPPSGPPFGGSGLSLPPTSVIAVGDEFHDHSSELSFISATSSLEESCDFQHKWQCYLEPLDNSFGFESDHFESSPRASTPDSSSHSDFYEFSTRRVHCKCISYPCPCRCSCPPLKPTLHGIQFCVIHMLMTFLHIFF